jgi:hypothetical protein
MSRAMYSQAQTRLVLFVVAKKYLAVKVSTRPACLVNPPSLFMPANSTLVLLKWIFSELTRVMYSQALTRLVLFVIATKYLAVKADKSLHQACMPCQPAFLVYAC